MRKRARAHEAMASVWTTMALAMGRSRRRASLWAVAKPGPVGLIALGDDDGNAESSGSPRAR